MANPSISSASLIAASAASQATAGMHISMERISTGMKLNGAADDPADAAQASRLNNEIVGTEQLLKNAMNGRSLVDTAEGAHNEIENILQRMREISVQAANDTNDADDRQNLSLEMQELYQEIDRIASVTKFAGEPVMFDDFTSKKFHVGLDLDTQSIVEVTLKSMRPQSLFGASTDISIDDTASAIANIAAIDDAIQLVNAQRSVLGSISNRLASTVNNLTNVSLNLTETLGVIQDADYAIETTRLAMFQILQQSATAMLAQENASRSNVLSLFPR